ncbi:MAG TPA: phosphate ABC transporter substrate-binding protein PstS [Sporichthyaceae bacterium]|nr:phosphate ABC transporter substrate-binding protein PstS [Sporichthyaceae bacterium]
MKFRRHGRLPVLLAAGLSLAACNTNNNSSTTAAPASTSAPASSSAPSSSSGSSTQGGATTAGITCGTGTLNGEGSTAQANAISQWVSDYQAQCKGSTINYNGTGSGAGIKQFLAGQVDWAGSDASLDPTTEAPLAKQHCGGNDAWNLPMAVGPIAVSYNVSGVASGLVLDGPTIAKIFTGKVTKWNDPAIAALNSGVTLPDKEIKVFFRSDDSGTTQNFEKYLAAAGGGAYTGTPAKQFNGGVGEGQAKSAGVQQAVKATDGGIGYLEYSFAKDGNLSIANVTTSTRGTPVALSAQSAGQALAAATQVGTGNDLSMKLDYATTTAGAYPIVLVTYEIVCSKGMSADKTALLKGFLSYTSSTAGQQSISALGYGTLPADLAAKVSTALAAITSA